MHSVSAADEQLPGHARLRGVPFPLIRIAGAPRERGRQYGKLAIERIGRTIEIYRRAYAAIGIPWDRVREIATTFAPDIKAFSPELFEEIRGIAEGSGLLMEEIVALNARTELVYWEERGEQFERDDGCTSVMVLPEASANGHLLHAWNWDWRDESADSTIVLDIMPETGPRVLTVVEAGLLARAGFNSAGIAVTGNNLEAEEVRGRYGVPAPLIRRAVLMSESYTMALKQVFDVKRSFSNNLMITSAGGEGVDLETTPDRVFWLQPEKGLLVHTNHFASPAAHVLVNDLSLAKGPDSLHRSRRVQAALGSKLGAITVDDLKQALDDRFDSPYAVCATPGKADASGRISSTVATMIMDTTAQVMHVASTPYAGATFTTYAFEQEPGSGSGGAS
ncbi:hypothetical protein FQY83_15185 [Luteimonas marina]|uniref:Peptidase C45 hydrolase domain-containing protein n=1 Tax=Luteimonas marina TaxID=488485 RepID=A0A5C5U008_9GAMM|nr:C45 family peptidase [Luteimonas marina]TWT18710.1 hypothetical protein FQY83_15185 [Luteimonas marina]